MSSRYEKANGTIRFALRSTLLALAAAGLASATPLAVLESTVGDFGNTSAGANAVGALDIGVNTITGRLAPVPVNIADADYFSLTLPGGVSILSISINVTEYATNFGNSNSTFTLLGPSNGTASFTTPGGIIPLSGLLINGTNLVFGIEPGIGAPFGQPDGFDYVVSITTQAAGPAIPEPGTWALAAAGLAAVSMLRRRSA